MNHNLKNGGICKFLSGTLPKERLEIRSMSLHEDFAGELPLNDGDDGGEPLQLWVFPLPLLKAFHNGNFFIIAPLFSIQIHF